MMRWHSLVRNFSVKPKPTRHKLFGKYLILTNTITSGVLMGTADAFQQTVDRYKHKENFKYDWHRMSRMFAIGIALGPVVHFWYTRLDIFWPGHEKRVVVKKVFADQLIASPIFLLLFFTGTGQMEGKSLGDCLGELKQKFPFMYMVEWFFWPPAQAINFLYLPPHFRVIYVNCLILGWDTFLSYMKHKDQTLPPFVHTETGKNERCL